MNSEDPPPPRGPVSFGDPNRGDRPPEPPPLPPAIEPAPVAVTVTLRRLAPDFYEWSTWCPWCRKTERHTVNGSVVGVVRATCGRGRLAVTVGRVEK